MNIFKRFGLIMVTVLTVMIQAFFLTACGNSGPAKITGFDFENYNITLDYTKEHTPFPYDAFGGSVTYSDGSKVKFEDMTQEAAEGIDYYITKYNTQNYEYEKWNESSNLTAGDYRLTFTYGSGIENTVYLTVNKINYTGTVSINMNNSQMNYGQALSKPTIYFYTDPIESVTYYYQEKTEDDSYRNDYYYEYNYTEDAICDIAPGNYQLYAVINTENYKEFKTALKEFVVKPSALAGKRYAYFNEEGFYKDNGDFDHYEYTQLENNTCEISYDIRYTKISDYIKSLYNVYLIEVDTEGNIKYDDNGEFVDKVSFVSAFDLTSTKQITFRSYQTDTEVTSAQTYSVGLQYTPDVTYYQPIALSNLLKIKVNKKQIYISKRADVLNNEGSYTSEIEYDGEEHHVEINVRKENNQWYGYETYYNNNEEFSVNLYQVTGCAATIPGTYTTVCTILSQYQNCMEFLWDDYNYETEETTRYTGSTVTLGKWTITKKYYSVEADVYFNNTSISDLDYTLLKNHSYIISADNFVVKNNNEVVDDAIVEIGNIYAYDSSDNGTLIGTITIDNENKYLTIASNCPEQSAYIKIEFILNKPYSETNGCDLWIYLKTGVHYTNEVYGEISQKQSADHFVYNEIDYFSNEYTYFYSADEVTYTRWLTGYASLYYAEENDNVTNYIQNESNVIDFSKTYYQKQDTNYVPVKFYSATLGQNYDTNQVGNIVSYDGKAKTVDGTIALTDIGAVSWSEHYQSFYTHSDQYVSNTSDEIDWTKTYYRNVNGNYQTVYFGYVDAEYGNYIYGRNENNKDEEYYIEIYDNETTQHVAFSEIYKTLYIHNDIYTQNTNATVDFGTTYYKKSGNEYLALYFYYKPDGVEGYVFTECREIDGVTEYYLAPNYHRITANGLEKLDGDTWVEVEEAREVGTYRTKFRIDWIDERVLLDEDGNYVSELYYQWEIVDNLTKVRANNEFVLKNNANETLTIIDGKITINQGDLVIVSANTQILDQHPEYIKVYQYIEYFEENPNTSQRSSKPVELNQSGHYVIQVIVVFDGDCVLADSVGNVVDCFEIEFDLIYQ